MVLPDSRRISRVPRYLGTVYTEIPAFRVRGFHPLWQRFPTPSSIQKFYKTLRAVIHQPKNSPATPCLQRCTPITQTRFRLFPFRSPLLWESHFDVFSSRYLDGSVPWVSLLHTMYSYTDDWYSNQPGYPIRLSPDQRMFAPPRGFSQLTTTFLAKQLLGIHRRPLFAWPYYHLPLLYICQKNRSASLLTSRLFTRICFYNCLDMEVWGFEPQTYGLQSHRSSQLSYTPAFRGNILFSLKYYLLKILFRIFKRVHSPKLWNISSKIWSFKISCLWKGLF